MKAIKNRLLAARAIWSFVDLVRHPEHLDRVFEIADAMSEQKRDVLEAMRDHFAMDPRGAAALREQAAARRPAGRAPEARPRARWGERTPTTCDENGLDPAALPTLPSDSDLAVHARAPVRDARRLARRHRVRDGRRGRARAPGVLRGADAGRAAAGAHRDGVPERGPLRERATASAGSRRWWTAGRWASAPSRSSGSAGTSSGTRPIDEVRALLGVKPYAAAISAAA